MATNATSKEATKKETPKKEIPKSEAKRAPAKKMSKALKTKYAVGIILIIIIIGVAIFANYYLVNSTGPGNIQVFQKNFDAAPRVLIIVAGYNGTVLSSTIGCATSLIEQIVASKTNHRDPSTIDLAIINQSSCTLSTGLEGKTNYTTTSLQNCLNYTKTEPALYINYSLANSTIIHPNYLYLSGDSLYLSECGVASQIS